MRLANLPRFVFFAGLGFNLVVSAASAATKTWDGGASPNNQWTNATNWSTDVAPVAGVDDLVFAGGVNLSTTNNFPVDSTFRGITFDATASSFNLGGARVSLPQGLPANSDLGADIGTTAGGGVLSTSTSAQTVSLPLQLWDGKHIVQTDAGNLSLSGVITRNKGATVVFDPAAGTSINVTGSGLTRDSSDGGGILGGWAALGGNEPNGANTNTTGDWATLDGSGNIVPYAAYTDITAGGAVTSSTTANLRYLGGADATFNITAADGTLINSLLIANATTGRTLTVTGTLKLGSANPGGASAGIYKTPVGPGVGNGTTFAVNGGTITVNGGGELSLLDSTNQATWSGFAAQNNNLTIGSVIADDGANPVHVNILGYAVLNGANTYTGNTTITQGRVQAGNAGGLSFGAAGSTVAVYAGGQLFLNANATFNYNWILNGVGSQESNGLGVVRAGAGRIMGGAITLASTSAIAGNNNNSATSLLISASITGPGGLIIGHGSVNGGTGTVRFGDGTGIQHYTYQGDTTINLSTFAANNTLAIVAGSNNLLPHGANRGNMILNGRAGGSGNLNLNGTAQTVNALNSAGDTPTNTFITGGVGSVLAVGDNNASGNFDGVISTEISVRKIGSGTQTLTSVNTYSGATQVYGGTLSITNPYLAIGSNVSVTSGAVFNLNFVGTNMINALFFGAIAQTTGTWGAPGSGAAHTDARFAGTGLLDVQMLGTNLLPGDFNGDHVVDALDLAKWQTETGFGGGADADYDGDSDGNDFVIWQQNLGLTNSVSASGAVPEPTEALLGAIAACGLVAARRRR